MKSKNYPNVRLNALLTPSALEEIWKTTDLHTHLLSANYRSRSISMNDLFMYGCQANKIYNPANKNNSLKITKRK